ncbi:MAG: phosphoglucosamine mutase [Hyphomonadaceae bacterium]|nr:MAG: phosphoglucosamine mutase [Caulobacteraceae bacterium]MBT9447337.1 phosphoglucosamine mutase [Hyphomonadaceae bacterium]TPW06354.1 MAG: phosphoglucosamine mutase [Alphaproteobacteria bacterium]
MERGYFGTDGIRGTANRFPMTPEIALRVGMAAGKRYRNGGDRRHSVVIGKDTRLSGYMIEPALVAGFTAVGMDVVLFGPLPTPAVAMLTRSLRADLGVMISASHNKYTDNGIKLFGPDGYKLSDVTEAEIEMLMGMPLDEGLAEPSDLGRAKRIDDSQARYIEIVKATFPRGLRLSGMRIVVDCANGAAYKVAPEALFELGAEVIPLGVEPNGFNINQEVGSTDTRALKDAVLKYRADLGIALDGDADRVVLVDERGATIDGDQLMALVATSFAKAGALTQPGIVATVMSNLGLERYLKSLSLKMERTKVGDRYVVEAMRAKGYNVGGEQSGHIILSDFSTTGDGLIAALQVLAVLVQEGKPVSEVCHLFEPAPQVLENVRITAGSKPLEAEAVRAAIKAAEKRLGSKGRILVRPSGTEPLVRVMAEGDDETVVREAVGGVVEAVQNAVKAA